MLDLLENDQQKILAKINCFYSELVKKYEAKKYKEKEYQRLCSIFQTPNDVKDEDIEDALAWKYGKTRENLRKNHKHARTIKSFKDSWAAYVKTESKTGNEAFKYWEKTVISSYISVAFISHLLFPSDIPIVDQHTFRSVRYFLDIANHSHGIKAVPNTYAEVQTLKEFVSCFAKLKNVSPREFDKYLMMFGKHVAPR